MSCDPVNNVDPTGLCPPCAGALLGAGIGGGLEAWQQYQEFGYVADWTKVGVHAAVGGVAGATGGWIAGALTPTVGTVAAAVIGGGIGNGAASGGSAAVDTAWRGGNLYNIFQQAAPATANGFVVGALTGGTLAGVGQAATQPFSRAAPSFRPLVEWQQPRTPIADFAAEVASQIPESTLSSAGEIYEAFRRDLPANCTGTYVRGEYWTVCWSYVFQ